MILLLHMLNGEDYRLNAHKIVSYQAKEPEKPSAGTCIKVGPYDADTVYVREPLAEMDRLMSYALGVMDEKYMREEA